MNVLLISANREVSPYPVFPIGLAYLAGPLAAAGHELEVLDLCFTSDPVEAVREAVARFVPGAVAISIRNVDNVTWPASRSYLGGIKEIVDVCRVRAPVILGGSGFSIMPFEILEFLDGDHGVVGEGEEILPLLIQALEANQTPRLPGVVSRGSSHFLPPRPLQRIGTPDRALFLLDRYHREGGMGNLQTKRGCPFSCIYCVYPLLEGNLVRPRPIPEIIREIDGLVGEGIDYLYFVDDVFNYPMEFAIELCRAITKARLTLNWSAFINPGFVDRPLLEAMVAAGCDAVEFGTESGSTAVLKALGKSFGTEEIRQASRLCTELKLDFAHYMLFGGPGETAETVRETFSLMDEVAADAVIAMTGIRIFPGTQLYRQALAEGIVTSETPLLEPVFYISPRIAGRLDTLVAEEALKRRNWVAPGLEINMNDAMLDVVRRFKVRGPSWKLIKVGGRLRTA